MFDELTSNLGICVLNDWFTTLITSSSYRKQFPESIMCLRERIADADADGGVNRLLMPMPMPMAAFAWTDCDIAIFGNSRGYPPCEAKSYRVSV